MDAHPDFGSYKDAKKGKHKVVADWREEVEVGIRKLSLADYMGYILTTDIPSEFCSAYYPPELSRLAAKHKANNTVGGVTDIDIDIVVGGEEPASHYEGQERFKKIKEHLLALAEMGDVCFITNSSELDVITHAPLHINPYLAT